MNDDDESNVTFQRRSHQVLSGPVTLPSLPLPSSTLPFPSPFSSHPPLPHPFLLPPLRSRPLKYSYGVWGSAVSSPNGVWGGAPVEVNRIWCILALKSHIW